MCPREISNFLSMIKVYKKAIQAKYFQVSSISMLIVLKQLTERLSSLWDYPPYIAELRSGALLIYSTVKP